MRARNDLSLLDGKLDIKALTAAVLEHANSTPGTDAGGAFAFFHSVATYAIQWLDHRRDKDLSGLLPAVFLLSSSPHNETGITQLKRLHLFSSMLSREIGGSFYLGIETLKTVYAATTSFANPDELFANACAPPKR